MRIVVIILVSLLLSNCTNSYVKNKKTITSPDDLQSLLMFIVIRINRQIGSSKCVEMVGVKI